MSAVKRIPVTEQPLIIFAWILNPLMELFFTFLIFPSLKSTAKIYDAWVNPASSSLSGIDSAPMN